MTGEPKIDEKSKLVMLQTPNGENAVSETVEMARNLLRQCQSGEIAGFALVGFRPNGKETLMSAGIVRQNATRILGGIAALRVWCERFVTFD